MSKDKYLAYNRPLTRDDQNKLKNIFETLDLDQQAYDFLEPVDHVGIIY
jgi:hypothetical protein